MEIFDFLRPQDAFRTRMRSFLVKARSIWRVNRGKFSFVFMISLGLHITVLMFLLSFQRNTASGLVKEKAANESAFKRALAELKNGDQSLGGGIDTGIRSQDIRFNPSIGEKERAEIYKRLLTSSGAEDQLSSGRKYFVDKSLGDGGGASVDILDNSDGAKLRRLRQPENYLKEAAPTFGDYVKVKPNWKGKALDSVPQEYFFRECPYEQILAKGAFLFAIVKGFPESLGESEHVTGASRPHKADRGESSTVPAGGFQIIRLQEMPSSSVFSERQAQTKKAAALTDKQIRDWLDEIMALPESAQFLSFRDRFLSVYDADDPQLARIAREFVASNLNTVYYFVDDFSLAFDGVEEMYYKRDVYDQFAAYWQANPRSRTGEELALALGGVYDFERREITRLLTIADEIADILAYRRGNTSVFNPVAKAYVLGEIRNKVERSLRAMGLKSIDQVRERYIDAESKIYSSIAEKPGPNRDRALWALGELYWDDMRYLAALDAWRRISGLFSSPVFEAIRGFLDLPDASIEKAILKIDKAFEDDSYTGTAQMLRRQRQFKKWLNRTNRLKGISVSSSNAR
jgi:hypothetical protein